MNDQFYTEKFFTFIPMTREHDYRVPVCKRRYKIILFAEISFIKDLT